jgi:hypothetical protein
MRTDDLLEEFAAVDRAVEDFGACDLGFKDGELVCASASSTMVTTSRPVPPKAALLRTIEAGAAVSRRSSSLASATPIAPGADHDYGAFQGQISMTFPYGILRGPQGELVVTGFNTGVTIDAGGR